MGHGMRAVAWACAQAAGPCAVHRRLPSTCIYNHKTLASCAQITQMYSDGQTHRPDVTLALYGFVQRHEPPLLCSEDLPGFTPERALHETPDTDEMLGESSPLGYADSFSWPCLACLGV